MNFLSIGNFGYREFVKNLVLNFQEDFLLHHNLTIVCLDRKLFRVLSTFVSKKKICNVHLEAISDLCDQFAPYNTKNFLEITSKKIDMIINFLKTREEVFFVDSDLSIFKDPEPAVRKKGDFDLLFQSDSPQNPFGTWQCTGCFYLRKNEKTIGFLQELTKILSKRPYMNDQDALKEYFTKKRVTDVRSFGELSIDIFDPKEFQNGYNAFQNKDHFSSQKIVIHANYRVGRKLKIKALIECGGWFLSPFHPLYFLYRAQSFLKSGAPHLFILYRYIKKFGSGSLPKARVAVSSNFLDQKEYRSELKKYCKKGYFWNDLYICSPEEIADYYVVVNFAPRWIEASKTMLFQSEWEGFLERFAPQDWLDLPSSLLANLRLPNSHTMVGWGITCSYNKLHKTHPTKNKILSAIISNKSELPLQKKRLDFVISHLSKLPYFDFFGKIHFGEEFKENCHLSAKTFYRGYLKKKEVGLFPYKYTFASENSRSPNYITEKLVDAILSETLCFYDGCPNAEDFFDPNAFIRINLDEPELSFQIIEKAIADNEWEKRIESIRNEKVKILEEYHLLARVESLLKGKKCL